MLTVSNCDVVDCHALMLMVSNRDVVDCLSSAVCSCHVTLLGEGLDDD